VETKPPTKSEEIKRAAGKAPPHRHTHESNDVVTPPRESIRQPWQQTFFQAVRPPFPSSPSNHPTQPTFTVHAIAVNGVTLPRRDLLLLRTHPNERISFPVPSQEQKNKQAWFNRSPGHLHMGRGKNTRAIARRNPPRPRKY